MEMISCPFCNMRVVLTQDGTCPSCRKQAMTSIDDDDVANADKEGAASAKPVKGFDVPRPTKKSVEEVFQGKTGLVFGTLVGMCLGVAGGIVQHNQVGHLPGAPALWKMLLFSGLGGSAFGLVAGALLWFLDSRRKT